MLKCMIENINAFKSIFKKLDEILLEVNIAYDSDGVRFHSIDKSKSIFVVCEMGKDFFKEFAVDESGDFSIDITGFNDVLNRVKKPFYLVHKDTTVEIIVEDKSTKTYQIKEVNIFTEDRGIPKLSYDVMFPIEYDYMKDLCKDIELYSKDVIFKVSGNQLNSSAIGMIGNFNDTYTLPYSFEDIEAESKYSLAYMKQILSADKISKTIQIKMDNNYPIQIEYEADGLNLTYILAPVIDRSEE